MQNTKDMIQGPPNYDTIVSVITLTVVGLRTYKKYLSE